MDVRAMEFKNEQFDFIIDKGFFDSILCGEMSNKNINKALSEIHRVLKPGGTYFFISAAYPDLRMHYLNKSELKWKVTLFT
jgi:ubiquinone/menaquinone biosynthesis C-methylase UbiE